MLFDTGRAIALQREMSKKVIIEPLDLSKVNIVIGLDVGYHRDIGYAVAVAIDFHSSKLVCYTVAVARVQIPYVPGLLAFREAPIMLAALREIAKYVKPDVIMVNGHGLAHPRMMGIASHIGLALDIPSVGVAKKRLFGEINWLNDELGEIIVDGMKVGYVVRRQRIETYITVGHRVDADSALELARSVWKTNRRFPDPIYEADRISRNIARKLRIADG